MRSPRRVTLTPIDWPSRSLKPAIERRALVTMGFLAADRVRSLTAPSMSDGCGGGPTDAHVDDDLLEAGRLHDVGQLSCSMRRARISSW
jgi:hypothetical protein